MSPDLVSATRYALERLTHELPAACCYHSLAHTRDDVAAAAARLAALEGLRGINLLLLHTAAYYHDLGFIVQRANHEEISVDIATQVLPAFGYRPSHINKVAAIIRATRLPQQPRSLAAQILADADLDVLGRDDFLVRNSELRQELANYGESYSDAVWYTQQLAFLRQHRYWTAAARALRDATKQCNQERLVALLSRTRG